MELTDERDEAKRQLTEKDNAIIEMVEIMKVLDSVVKEIYLGS